MIITEICLLTAVAIPLFFGAYHDWKRRIIPDVVPVTIAVCGLLCAVYLPPDSVLYVPLLHRATGCLIPAAALHLIARKKGGAGGGDIKLTASLGFLIGLYGLLPVLTVTTVTGVSYGIVTRHKSIPLAVFISLGFIVYMILAIKYRL